MYEARENRVRRGFGHRARTPIIADERMTKSNRSIRHGTENRGHAAATPPRDMRTKLTLRKLSSVVFQLKLLNTGMQSASVVRSWKAWLHRGAAWEVQRN